MSLSNSAEIFFLYDSSGAPLTGITCSFVVYQNFAGSPQTQPSIVEIGGGAYGFQPSSGDIANGICYIIDATTASVPRYLNNKIPDAVDVLGTPATSSIAGDIAAIKTLIGTSPGGSYGTVFANLEIIRKIETNRWKIITTGGGANTMVIYADDGTTPLLTFNLYDSSGVPTYTNPYERLP